VEIAIGAILVAAIGGLVLAFAPFVAGETVLGLPVRHFLAGLIAPILFVALIFWLARRQERIDQRFDVAED
jgi:putative solute:sodium symporter small subunit